MTRVEKIIIAGIVIIIAMCVAVMVRQAKLRREFREMDPHGLYQPK